MFSLHKKRLNIDYQKIIKENQEQGELVMDSYQMWNTPTICSIGGGNSSTTDDML